VNCRPTALRAARQRCSGSPSDEQIIAKLKDLEDFKDYHGAIQDFNKVIELNPNYALAYFYRGTAKSDLEDYHGAIKDYNKAIELYPKYAHTYVCG